MGWYRVRTRMRFDLGLASILAACATAGGGDDDSGASSDVAKVDAGEGGVSFDAEPMEDAGSDVSMSSCASPFSGVLATWDLTGEPGTQTSTAAKTTAPGVTAGVLTRSQGLTAVAGANSINSSNWATSSTLDPMRYYTFAITPPAGCAMDITSLAVDVRSSSTGPTMAAMATSADNYMKTTPLSTVAPGMVMPMLVGATKTVEVRFYGWMASASGGTMRVENTLSVSGALK